MLALPVGGAARAAPMKEEPCGRPGARALARLSAGGDQEVEGGREEKGGWIGSGSIRSRRRHHHHQLMQLPQLSNISMSSLAVRRSGRQAGRKADRQEVAAVDSTAAAAHKGEIIIAALSPASTPLPTEGTAVALQRTPMSPTPRPSRPRSAPSMSHTFYAGMNVFPSAAAA